MENKLRHTLSNYEALPPSHLWEDIEAALDHQMAPHAAVLSRFQQVPPSHIWDKIKEALPAVKEEKVIPLYSRKPGFLRYAAAAAVLILVAAAITLFVNNSGDKTEIAKQTEPVASEQQVDTGTSNTPNVYNAEVTQKTVPLQKYNAEATAKTSKSGGRYLTRADEEGKKVRVSKKVASVFNCADNIASVDNLRCKEDIESLRQKISTSLISPSGDFSGLIDMIKTLEENE